MDPLRRRRERVNCERSILKAGSPDSKYAVFPCRRDARELGELRRRQLRSSRCGPTTYKSARAPAALLRRDLRERVAMLETLGLPTGHNSIGHRSTHPLYDPLQGACPPPYPRRKIFLPFQTGNPVDPRVRPLQVPASSSIDISMAALPLLCCGAAPIVHGTARRQGKAGRQARL